MLKVVGIPANAIGPIFLPHLTQNRGLCKAEMCQWVGSAYFTRFGNIANPEADAWVRAQANALVDVS